MCCIVCVLHDPSFLPSPQPIPFLFCLCEFIQAEGKYFYLVSLLRVDRAHRHGIPMSLRKSVKSRRCISQGVCSQLVISTCCRESRCVEHRRKKMWCSCLFPLSVPYPLKIMFFKKGEALSTERILFCICQVNLNLSE